MKKYYICNGISYTSADLMHYGILGMKWGIRRFQNKDGTLTNAGKKRKALVSDEEKHLSEKARRSKLTKEETISELEEITRPVHEPYHNYTETEKKRFEKFDNEIRKFSGDWYWGEGVSKTFTDRVNKYNKDRDDIENKYSDAEKQAMNKLRQVEDEVILSYCSTRNRESIRTSNRVADDKDYDRAWIKSRNDPRLKEAKSDYDKIYKQKDNEISKIRNQYHNDILGVVLDDLGYKDSPEARELIRDTVLYD